MSNWIMSFYITTLELNTDICSDFAEFIWRKAFFCVYTYDFAESNVDKCPTIGKGCPDILHGLLCDDNGVLKFCLCVYNM